MKFLFNAQFRRLAHGLSLMFSFIMGVMLLVTSSMMANIYVKYCNYLKDHAYDYNPYYYSLPAECGEDEKHFVILPLFGYFAMIVWVRFIYS